MTSTELPRQIPPVRRRARPIPPNTLKDCYWWLTQVNLAVRDVDLRKWLLRKWGCKPYRTVDRRKRPLRIAMRFVTLTARVRELEIMKMREANMSFRAIGRALGISHVAAYKRFWCARNACRAEQLYQDRSLRSILQRVNSWINYYQWKAAEAN
jgi:hypothetical protein